MDTSKTETKYERLRKIGIGSYGVVFKCVNRQTGQIVAIKRYSENDTDPIIRKIAMREVRMLRQLKHPNLIHLIEVFRRKRILHLVFDYCELTVLDVIEKYANNCPLNLIRKIIWQLVNGVSHCHSHNCIHRDIKPENILINQSGVVKLCDFGFARNISSSGSGPNTGPMSAKQVKYEREAQLLGVSTNQMNQFMLSTSESNKRRMDQQQQQMFDNNKENQQSERLALTEYVATRWYRAPELLVGDVYYDKKIDIWAIGCVTAELMRGEPTWPGKTDLDQLFMIKNSLGPLTTAQTHTLITQGLYEQANLERLLNRTNVTDPLERKLPQRVGQSGMDFVLECLQMDPAKRPTCDELLQHQYIQSAQMTQFVRGVSHNANPSINNQEESMNLAQRNSNRGTHDSSTSSDQRTTTNGNRSNSQAILMMANSSNQQPATKRLLIASDDVGANSLSYNSKHSSMVPVPVRSRQNEGNGGAAGTWSQAEASSRQQNSKQQFKRKIEQSTTSRAVASDLKLSKIEQKRQTTRNRKPPVTSHRAPISSESARRKQFQSNDNLYRSSEVTDETLASRGESLGSLNESRRVARNVDSRGTLTGSTSDLRKQLGRSSNITRRDRQQTNLGFHNHQKNNMATNNKVEYRRENPAFPNTNSSASSSSPTSFGTNRSSSNSFLPAVQR